MTVLDGEEIHDCWACHISSCELDDCKFCTGEEEKK